MKPYFDSLRDLTESVVNPKKKELAEKEAAITTWENDPKRNTKKLKVVRGSDGLPVEVVMETNHTFALVVNGKAQSRYSIDKLTGGSFNDPIPQLCLSGDLAKAYDVRAVQRLDYSPQKAIYVLTGTIEGNTPGLVVKAFK